MSDRSAGVRDGAGEKVRLFVALELPETARSELVSWRAGVLEDVEGLRPVSLESLHVTLCFLGWRPSPDVHAIAAALGALSGEAPARLAFRRGLWLPRRRPRVLTVELDDQGGALAAVQERLACGLEAGGWYERERRSFLPHVTVARVKNRIRAAALPAVPECDFQAKRVTLFQSRLQSGGARYEALETVTLG